MIRTIIYDCRQPTNQPPLSDLPDVVAVMKDCLKTMVIKTINVQDDRRSSRQIDPMQPRHHSVRVERVEPGDFGNNDVYVWVGLPDRNVGDFAGRRSRRARFAGSIHEAVRAAFAEHPDLPLPIWELEVTGVESSGLRINRLQDTVGGW